MSYILSDIQAKVQRRIRDTGYSTSEITDYLNDTQNDIFNEYRLPFMEAYDDFAQSDDEIDFPDDYVQAIDLRIITDGKEIILTPTDISEMSDHYPQFESGDDSTAQPERWYRFAQIIKVYPRPDQSYTFRIHYYKRPTLLSSASSVPDIPSEFEELLVEGAAYRILQIKDQYDQAGIHQNKYDELLQKLVMRYTLPQVGRPQVMRINRVGRTPIRDVNYWRR